MDYKKALHIAKRVQRRDAMWTLAKECRAILKENTTAFDKEGCEVTIKVPLTFLDTIAKMAEDKMEELTEEISKL